MISKLIVRAGSACPLFAKLAALTLAITFTLSCSGDDSSGDNNPGTSSPSGGNELSSSGGNGGGENNSSSSVTGGGESSSSATGGGSSSSVGGGGTALDGTWSRGNGSYAFTISGNNWVYAENGNQYSKGTLSTNVTPTAPSTGTVTLTVINVISGSSWANLPAQYESVKTNTATFTINAAGNEMVISNAALTTSGVWGTLQGTYTKGSGGSSSSSSATGGGSSSSNGQTGVINGTPVTYGTETYETVVIGEQTWLARNLNYDVPGNDTDVCYDNDPDNCVTYGRLYDWATAMDIEAKYNEEEWGGSDEKHQGICPAGWHIPNKAEWQILLTINGKELKSTSGWRNKNDGSNGNGTDDYGFSARPGGIYSHEYDSFSSIGGEGYWWTATGTVGFVGSAGYTRIANSDNTRVSDNKKGYGYSLRCVKD